MKLNGVVGEEKALKRKNAKEEEEDAEEVEDEEGIELQAFISKDEDDHVAVVRSKTPSGSMRVARLPLLFVMVLVPIVWLIMRRYGDGTSTLSNKEDAAAQHMKNNHKRSHPPPLNRLVQGKRIVKPVDWLLDFSIIGYPKCGTSFLKYWLSLAPSVYVDNFEVRGFVTHNPEKVANHFHTVVQEHHESFANHSLQWIGMKNPGDIDALDALQSYERYFFNTKFIVLLRHPVLWFQSFYNFRYRNLVHKRNGGRDPQPLNSSKRGSHKRPSRTIMPRPQSLVGSCWKRYHAGSSYSCDGGTDRGCNTRMNSVCTNRAQFHHAISRLGLTPLDTEEEWSLLNHHDMTLHPVKHEVLFLELSQLRYDGTDGRRNQEVQETLQSFLGLTDLPPLPQYSVSYERVDGEIDICEHQYDGLRAVLLDHGRNASQWILQYLLQSNQTVVASRDQFIKLLQKWSIDPCPRLTTNSTMAASNLTLSNPTSNNPSDSTSSDSNSTDSKPIESNGGSSSSNSTATGNASSNHTT